MNQAVLFIVATPIGNLSDFSPRAIETLQTVDLILAEDTRHSKPLLQHYCINTPCVAYHDYSSEKQVEGFIERLQAGESIALISDAGTPLVSDPGYRLVSLARQAGVTVTPVPGACALIAALSASGLPTDSFRFDGFLPAKTAARQQALQAYRFCGDTVILYESTHRILDLLQDCQQLLGDTRQLVLAREITKKFETFLEGTASELIGILQQDPVQQKGEFVVMIAPGETRSAEQQDVDRLLGLLIEELPGKTAAKIVAAYTGLARKELYQRTLELK